jgi:hypothetical protein
MNRFVTFTVTNLTLLCLAVALPVGAASAQEKQRVSFKVDAANAKYTQQLFLDVGDVPGHQVRAYEQVRTYPNNAPMINGVKVKENWTRGVSDYTDNNGPNNSYGVYVMENGDKFFVRTATLAQSAGAGKLNFTSVSSITGGTGKLAGIHGTIKSTGVADPKVGFVETLYDIEYWMDK